jgi:hypothetical protein
LDLGDRTGLVASKILFAGGCHVSGYPVGATLGFAQLTAGALQAAGMDCEWEAYGHAAMSRPARLTARCRAARPDLLVLQLGHRESLGTLRSHVFARLGLPRAHTAPSIQRTYTARPELFLHDGLAWKVKSSVKRTVDRALGHPLVHVQRFEEAMETCLAQVREVGAPNVMVLSPLPCADPVTMSYRRELLPIYRSAAQRNGFEFIDLIHLAARPPMDWFADPVHLSRHGHASVAAAIAAAIQRIPAQAREVCVRP